MASTVGLDLKPTEHAFFLRHRFWKNDGGRKADPGKFEPQRIPSSPTPIGVRANAKLYGCRMLRGPKDPLVMV